jgi:hypothetical protein
MLNHDQRGGRRIRGPRSEHVEEPRVGVGSVVSLGDRFLRGEKAQRVLRALGYVDEVNRMLGW